MQTEMATMVHRTTIPAIETPIAMATENKRYTYKIIPDMTRFESSSKPSQEIILKEQNHCDVGLYELQGVITLYVVAKPTPVI